VLGLPDTRCLLRQGETGHLIHLISGFSFRSNVGFMEVTGQAVTVEVKLFNDLNAPLGTKTYTLLPLGFHQVSNIFQDMGITANHPAARAEVRVLGTGAVLAYASIIDNVSNDAIFTVAQKLLGVSTEAQRTLAVAAHTGGAKGTQWKSDVRVFNPTGAALDVTYTYRPDGGTPMVETQSVPSMNIQYVGDALLQLFNVSQDTHGSLQVSAGSALLVSSRIYNAGDAGTYGQYVPSNRTDQGIVADSSGIILGLQTNDGYRTNLGLTETAGGGLTVKVSLYDINGVPLTDHTVDLQPYQHIQWNEIYGLWGLSGARAGYAVIKGVSGVGRVAAYASVVDNSTGDAIYVPAQ